MSDSPAIESARAQVEAALASLFAATVALGAALEALEASDGESPQEPASGAPAATQAPIRAPEPIPPGHPDSNPVRDSILTMGQPPAEL
jgi:hypothetical protein